MPKICCEQIRTACTEVRQLSSSRTRFKSPALRVDQALASATGAHLAIEYGIGDEVHQPSDVVTPAQTLLLMTSTERTPST